jgi:DnaJ-class molecular chaperone
MWVANSGTHANVAYVLEIVNGIVRSCSCPAGEYGDPCCKHAARYYLDAGVLDPEPDPPVPALAACGYCFGRGWETVTGKSGAAYRFDCQVCEGSGTADVGDDDEPSPAVAPLPAAQATTPCDRCQGDGTLTMTVAGGCGVYPTPVTCRACSGAGTVAALAA